MKKSASIISFGITIIAVLTNCGGGGGGGSSSVGDSPQGGELWLATANVATDTCGERISPVRQNFIVNKDGDGVVVDTSIVSVAGTSADSGFNFGFSDVNGDCQRTYLAEFSDVSGSNANVKLTNTTVCGGATCESTWLGTAIQGQSNARAEDLQSYEKVRGENCLEVVPPGVAYRPSTFECNGNAAILLAGSFRNAYSVVVRRNGEFNDRDPLNPNCGTNRCSPYKVQKRIELPEYQVNCLGETGFSDNYAVVKRISIKFTALVTNASDPSQFEQYCLNNPQADLN